MADLEDRQTVDPLRVVTLALLALMVIAFIGGTVYQVIYVGSQRETAECYQEAFRELNASLLVSRDAAKQDRAQLRTLILSFTDPGATREGTREALDRYVDALDDADRQRLAAPLPNRTCD